MANLTIPARCRRVYACLAGHTDKPLSVRMTGKWSNRDLQEITGQSAADVRMRELVRLNPGEIDFEKIPGHTGGALRFWLHGRPWTPTPAPATRRTRADEPATLFTIDKETL